MEEETTDNEDHFHRCIHSNARRFSNLLIRGIIIGMVLIGMGLAAAMLAAVAIIVRTTVQPDYPAEHGWEIKLDESCPGFSTGGRPTWFTTLEQEAVPVKWPDVDSVSWFEEGDHATIMDRLQHIFYECIYFYTR